MSREVWTKLFKINFRLWNFRQLSTLNNVAVDSLDIHTRRYKSYGEFDLIAKQDVERNKKVLSILVAGNVIAWSVLNRDDNRLELQELALKPIEIKPSMGTVAMLNEVKMITNLLPQCDLVIIEEPPTTAPKPNLVPYVMLTTQNRSFLMGLLSSRNDSKLVAVKSKGIAKTFGIFVGTEKVSGQHIVEEIFKNHTISQNCQVSEELRSHYKRLDRKQREILSSVFLLNMAYWKLTGQFPMN